jgi:hypothetical protein
VRNLRHYGQNYLLSQLILNTTEQLFFIVIRGKTITSQKNYTMIEVIFKIFLTDYIDFQGFITKRIQKPLLIEYKQKFLHRS